MYKNTALNWHDGLLLLQERIQRKKGHNQLRIINDIDGPAAAAKARQA